MDSSPLPRHFGDGVHHEECQSFFLLPSQLTDIHSSGALVVVVAAAAAAAAP